MVRLLLSYAAQRLKEIPAVINAWGLYRKYRMDTLVSPFNFIGCLLLVRRYTQVAGLIVECGVWRGGMSAAMAEVLGPERIYYLFDSFEGLPVPSKRDGKRGQDWLEWERTELQNCAAPEEFARKSMRRSGAKNVHFVKGWFSETLPGFAFPEQIAVLRLDGDLYESTMTCLVNLWPVVAQGGVVILDDYCSWEGCRKALHDFLSQHDIDGIIRESPGGVSYLIKS